MGEFLNHAKEHLEKLDYKISKPFVDNNEYPIGYYVFYKNRWHTLIAFEKFYLKKQIGACKSIDVKIIDDAIKKENELLIYVHEPTYSKESECYTISPNKIKHWAEHNDIYYQQFRKYDFCELRTLYDLVPLSQLGMKNIRTDRSRRINKGEKLWQPYLKTLEYIYIGDQHNDPIYKEIFGYTPDFANFNKKIIIEEGIHSKKIEDIRKKLAKKHGFKIFFIPHDYNFYNKYPEAINLILESIKYL